jgi:hypothetical protein
MLAEGGSTDDILAFSKDRGADAIGSIRALQRLLGVSVAEAQQLLRDSDVWREMR